MKRYSVRPATFADIEAVCSLIAKQNIADYGEAMTTTDDLIESWQTMELTVDSRSVTNAPICTKVLE
jgi:hypothetical protein